MVVNKYNGHVYGAKLTTDEKKAMDIEIKKQLAEYDKKHSTELDAAILWQLHEHFGFGPKRLKRFYDAFIPQLDDLVERYSLADEEQIWLCTHKLKEYGIDLEEWSKKG